MPNLRRFAPIRNANAPELVELFLVASVASVLAIRWFLALTGYPQIGGSGLHIAHMLWGGLFMLIALLLLFATLGRTMQRFAAILGGIGFGTFIDELGKFITSDNDYFYQPTIGLIYIIFIVIFLATRALRTRADLPPAAALSNALTLLAPAASGRPDAATRQEILRLLSRADAANPIVPQLRSYVGAMDAGSAAGMGFYFGIRDRLARAYGLIARRPWFRAGLLAFFAVFVLAQIGVVIYLIAAGSTAQLAFNTWAQLASSLVGALLVAWGIWRLRRSRLAAYRWFARATLLSIFVTQVFAFLDAQLAALTGLAISLLIYAALRYMMEMETGES